jgi:hypothetical protein
MRRASQPRRQERRHAPWPWAFRRSQQRRTSSILERKQASCCRARTSPSRAIGLEWLFSLRCIVSEEDREPGKAGIYVVFVGRPGNELAHRLVAAGRLGVDRAWLPSPVRGQPSRTATLARSGPPSRSLRHVWRTDRSLFERRKWGCNGHFLMLRLLPELRPHHQ